MSDYTAILPQNDKRSPTFVNLKSQQSALQKIVDVLGEKSSKAQDLSKVLTTVEKLRNSTQILYLLKDPHADGGAGRLIGLLKVGHKKLFLYDARSRLVEVEPLCILDFFVESTRQRQGAGRRLFDYMLRDQATRVTELAIDGPSPLMLSFLAKNYAMKDLQQQPNNFAVSAQFFKQDVTDTRPARVEPPPQYSGNRRFAAKQAKTTAGSVIHGDCAEVPADDRLEWAGSSEVSAMSGATDDAEAGAGRAARPVSLPLPPPTPAAGISLQRRDSQVTDQGFFNIKFYHNKLW